MIVNFCDQVDGDNLIIFPRASARPDGTAQEGRPQRGLPPDGETRLASPTALFSWQGSFGKVPPWLYQENPLVALVQVTRPGSRERHSFLRGFVGNFHEGGGQGSDEVERLGASSPT